MTMAYATDIVTWRYPEFPYDCYDMTGARLRHFSMSPSSGYLALIEKDRLIGFRNISRFPATADGRGYEILIRREPAGNLNDD